MQSFLACVFFSFTTTIIKDGVTFPPKLFITTEQYRSDGNLIFYHFKTNYFFGLYFTCINFSITASIFNTCLQKVLQTHPYLHCSLFPSHKFKSTFF